MRPTSLHFPNVAFRIVRSALPPHQHVFRFPPRLNKVDIASLLTGLYGLRITDIRTMIYNGRSHYVRSTGSVPRRTNAAAYKKVIVTTKDDFEFPPPVSTKLHGAIPIPPRRQKNAPSVRFRHLLPPPDKDDPVLKKQMSGTSVQQAD